MTLKYTPKVITIAAFRSAIYHLLLVPVVTCGIIRVILLLAVLIQYRSMTV